MLDFADSSEFDSPKERATALSQAFGIQMDAVKSERPVVTYDEDGAQHPDPVDAREASRIHPDGWPVYADDPWASYSDLVASPYLQSLVMHIDRKGRVDDSVADV
jgi:hypothetical protein